MGRLSDKYGRLPLITAGLVLGGIATAALILVSNYFAIAVMIAVFGLGLATVTASTSCLVADLSRAQGRGGALGILSSIMDVGQSTGPMVAGALITAYSYGLTFGVIGAALVIISLIYWFGMRKISVCPPEIK
jgi:MFS transporter, DHA1 family, multidrug resistance protein